MATFMEKDVLLENATLGYLITGLNRTDKIDKDEQEMNELYWDIMMKEPREIDYDKMCQKIKFIKEKYERNG